MNHNGQKIDFMSFFKKFLLGVDGYFQSQTYTFGMCGPLELTPAEAGHLNTTYFAAYLIGRIISIPLSQKLQPRIILFASIVGYLIISALLVMFGGSNPYFLYVGTGSMGFAICFQFGCGLTWLASKLPQMKPHHTSLMFIGGNLGWFIFPMVASQIFEVFGPMFVFYLTLILTCAHCVLFFILNKLT